MIVEEKGIIVIIILLPELLFRQIYAVIPTVFALGLLLRLITFLLHVGLVSYFLPLILSVLLGVKYLTEFQVSTYFNQLLNMITFLSHNLPTFYDELILLYFNYRFEIIFDHYF